MPMKKDCKARVHIRLDKDDYNTAKRIASDADMSFNKWLESVIKQKIWLATKMK
jgi:predicted HicB family RNase H-like nuclease